MTKKLLVVASKDTVIPEISSFFKNISIVQSCQEAVEALSECVFDCIVCFQALGSGNQESGMSLIKELRNRKNQLPIILLCEHADGVQPWEALNLGADDFMSAPYCVEEMIVRIQMIYKRYAKIHAPHPDVIAPNFNSTEFEGINKNFADQVHHYKKLDPIAKYSKLKEVSQNSPKRSMEFAFSVQS